MPLAEMALVSGSCISVLKVCPSKRPHSTKISQRFDLIRQARSAIGPAAMSTSQGQSPKNLKKQRQHLSFLEIPSIVHLFPYVPAYTASTESDS